MKLVSFDADNIAYSRKGAAIISFSKKGASSLSKLAATNARYEGGNLIAFHQDEENPQDWFFSLSESGFTLRDDNESGALSWNSVGMAHRILDALSIESDRASFMVAAIPVIIDEVEYWPIITLKPIFKTRKKKS